MLFVLFLLCSLSVCGCVECGLGCCGRHTFLVVSLGFGCFIVSCVLDAFVVICVISFFLVAFDCVRLWVCGLVSTLVLLLFTLVISLFVGGDTVWFLICFLSCFLDFAVYLDWCFCFVCVGCVMAVWVWHNAGLRFVLLV